jgi:hypothetical protein
MSSLTPGLCGSYRPQSGLALLLASIDSAVYSPVVCQRSVSPSVSPSFSQDIEANSPPYYDFMAVPALSCLLGR